MRSPGAPVRFLVGVAALWIAGRAAFLLAGREAEPVSRPAELACASCGKGPAPSSLPLRPLQSPEAATPSFVRPIRSPLPQLPHRLSREGGNSFPPALASVALEGAGDTGLRRADDGKGKGEGKNVGRSILPLPPQGLAAIASPAAMPAPSRWSGSAWLFARGGSNAVTLAGGGQLGGSQAGVRIAYAVDSARRLAVAARAYAPLRQASGSEAALGLDLRPLPDIPFRLSLERRIAVGRDGRDAWSAYAAGGFFRGIGRSLELDGYGQAGVVGIRSRDLFADGAIRLAGRIEAGGGAALLAGGGVWGAAQPGAARLDVGPHLAVRVPAGRATLSLAADWRLRVAGDARPGSGPAITLATDF